MIRNQWYVVLESTELGSRPVGVSRMGERLVFWRDGGGRAVCHLDACAHRGASLAGGDILRDASGRLGPSAIGNSESAPSRLRCPFHGLEYDPSGRCVFIPANGRSASVPEGFWLRTYPTYEERGLIWIWWGDGAPAPPPTFFEDIGPEFFWSTKREVWRAHYSRAIENQLDMAHLPFVHRNTIGRGNRTLVEGPGLLFRKRGFFVYVFNKVDDGSPPRSSEEIPVPPPDRDFKLEFQFPNLWQNYIGQKVRVVIAFVPIDGENTILYIRFYQSFARLPLLRGIAHFVGDIMDLVISRQDRRVVETQVPRGEYSGGRDLLFPGDRAIMEYRKLRAEAERAAL